MQDLARDVASLVAGVVRDRLADNAHLYAEVVEERT